MSLTLFLPGELHDEDGVLAGQPDQDDQANLGEDVVVGTLEPDAHHGTEQGHGHNEEDDQRQTEAFVLGRQHQKNQQDAQREDVHGGVASDPLLVGQLGPLIGHARRQGLLHQTLDKGLSLARAVARGRSTIDFCSRIAVVAHHAVGTEGLTHRHQGAHRHHLTALVADLETADVVGPIAELRIGLGHHLISATELVEVIHVERAQVNLQGLVQTAQRNTQRLGLHAVHVEVDLRHIDLIRRIDPLQYIGGVGRANGSPRRTIERLGAEVGPVLDVHLEAAARAQAIHRRGVDDNHSRLLDLAKSLIQLAYNGVG